MGDTIDMAVALSTLAARKRLGRFFLGGFGTLEDVTSTDVRAAQAGLRALGFNGKNGAPLTVDGQWGTNTSFAALAFRSKQGLPLARGNTAVAVLDSDFTSGLQAALSAAGKTGTAASLVASSSRPAAVSVSPSLTPPPAAGGAVPGSISERLLAPGAPFYKKPIVWIGAGVALLAVVMLFARRQPQMQEA